MNIAIIGYGKMGKAIEQIALQRNHTIVLKIDTNNNIDDLLKHKIDVAIEFSTPETAFNNILFCIQNNIPVITGTTGWLDKYDEVVGLCNEKNGSFLQSSNFSIGVNIFFELNKRMAQIINSYPDFEVKVHEEHHIHKKDAPSGTAIKVAENIIENLDRKQSWTKENATQNQILITSTREGEIFGNHFVTYETPIDTIEISHKAQNRNGFATGAILAAEYIHDKKGVFTMSDIMKF